MIGLIGQIMNYNDFSLYLKININIKINIKKIK